MNSNNIAIALCVWVEQIRIIYTLTNTFKKTATTPSYNNKNNKKSKNLRNIVGVIT